MGRRFKTKTYKDYEETMLYLLPKRLEIPEGKMTVKYLFGLSSKGADVDNLVKPFTDILQKKYGFDDRRIYRMEIEKVDVKKGAEFIDFELYEKDTD